MPRLSFVIICNILRLGVQRKHRFSEQFHEDTTNLVSSITSDIIGKYCIVINQGLSYLRSKLQSMEFTQNVVYYISVKRHSNPRLVESLNASLAFFLHDLLR